VGNRLKVILKGKILFTFYFILYSHDDDYTAFFLVKKKELEEVKVFSKRAFFYIQNAIKIKYCGWFFSPPTHLSREKVLGFPLVFPTSSSTIIFFNH
jgi:hypothetical protein